MKTDLQKEIERLHAASRRLLSLGEDRGYVYAEELSRLNREVYGCINAVIGRRGKDARQEAELCLGVLMGYSACMYANPWDCKRREAVVKRSCRVLERLEDSLLKCRLLTYCYGEVYDGELAARAHAIMEGWQGRPFSKEEQEVAEILSLLECNFCLSLENEFHFI